MRGGDGGIEGWSAVKMGAALGLLHRDTGGAGGGLELARAREFRAERVEIGRVGAAAAGAVRQCDSTFPMTQNQTISYRRVREIRKNTP